MTKANDRQRSPYKYSIWDKFEGKVNGQVWAFDDDEAEEEAMIAASERGCSMVEEVEVYKITDC